MYKCIPVYVVTLQYFRSCSEWKQITISEKWKNMKIDGMFQFPFPEIF